MCAAAVQLCWLRNRDRFALGEIGMVAWWAVRHRATLFHLEEGSLRLWRKRHGGLVCWAHRGHPSRVCGIRSLRLGAEPSSSASCRRSWASSGFFLCAEWRQAVYLPKFFFGRSSLWVWQWMSSLSSQVDEVVL